MLHLPVISLDDPNNARRFRYLVIIYLIAGLGSILLWRLFGIGDWNRRDFLQFWHISRIIHHSPAELVYSLRLYPSDQWYQWRYPPLALLLYWPLGQCPWQLSWLLYTAVTGLLLIAVMYHIVEKPMRPLALWATLASPAIAFSTYQGQNGVINAAFMGLALVYLRRSPPVSGLGGIGLACKPHLAPLLFFLELIRYPKTFFITIGMLLAAMGLTLLLWGVAPWKAWIAVTTNGGDVLKISAEEDWPLVNCMASAFFAARLLGLSIAWSGVLQAMVAVAALGMMLILWRREDVAFDLKAAAVPIATFLLSPYMFYYDYPLLLPGLAFWLRHVYRHGSRRWELHFILLIWALPLCLNMPAVLHLLPVVVLLAALAFLNRRQSIPD